MTREQERINREFKKRPWTNKTFFNRPHWTRRQFFEICGAGVSGAFLTRRYAHAQSSVETNSGAVTKNTLTAPSPVVTENLQGTSTVTGTIGVTSDRKFTIAGYVNTSHGKVWTSVAAHQDFSSTQTIDFDTVNFTVLDQNTAVQSKVSATSTVSRNDGTVVTSEDFSFPITVDLVYPVSGSAFGYNVTTTQNYQSDKRVWSNQRLGSFSTVNNFVTATDVSPGSSSQNYTAFDADGNFYSCQIASAKNTLTKVSRGCNPDKH